MSFPYNNIPVYKLKFAAFFAGVFLSCLLFSGCYPSNFYGYPPAGNYYHTTGGFYMKAVGNTRLVEFKAIGKGIAPVKAKSKGQAILLAERAAIMDGYRKLAESVNGVYIDQYTQYGNGKMDFDYIRTETEGILAGAEILRIEHAEYGIAEAHVRVRFRVGSDHILYRFGTK